ncbi:MAG: YqeG family HAD IIIA-type phosphatase [Thermacetogeniaceae bacterium]
MFVELLRPKQIYKSILDIPLEQLYNNGIRGIIIDLDNTLTEWNSSELSRQTLNWLRRAEEIGLRLCFVSNNSDERVRKIAEMVGVPFVARARKPRRRSFIRAMELMRTGREETAVVGDQIFTDILGGNRLGLFTILVTPLSKREFIGTRFMRLLERLVLYER